MNKRAQTLMVSLWLLVILTIFTVGIGHRVSIALRLSRYQRDKLRATYLAKAGLNIAILELEKDDQNFDNLNDLWSNNEEKFKKIAFDDNQTDFATVSYETLDEDNNPESIYGVIDEERKININTVSSALLAELLKSIEVANSAEIANDICAWRGDTNITIPDYTELGYTNKADRFVNKNELLLVKDIDRQIYDKLKSQVTTWGYGRVNVNTTSKEILEILVEYCRNQLIDRGIDDNDPEDLVDRIIEVRPANNFSDLQGKLSAQGNLNSGQINVLNELQKVIDFKSSCFYIESNGKINNNKRSSIQCVFDRLNNRILYWHES